MFEFHVNAIIPLLSGVFTIALDAHAEHRQIYFSLINNYLFACFYYIFILLMQSCLQLITSIWPGLLYHSYVEHYRFDITFYMTV